MTNSLQKLGQTFLDAMRTFRFRRTWQPLLGFWLLWALTLGLLSRFADLPLGEAVGGLLSRLMGNDMVEYPRYFLRLPDLQRPIYLFMAGTIGVLCQAVALLRLLPVHSRGQIQRDRKWRRALKLWPKLFLINAASLALVLGPVAALRAWVPEAVMAGGAGKALNLAAHGVGVVSESFLLYWTLNLLMQGGGIWKALLSSLRFARRHLVVSVGIVAAPLLAALFIQQIFQLRHRIVWLFKPELLLYLMYFSSFVIMMLLFLQLSALSRFYLDQVVKRPFSGEWDDKPRGS